jgi:GT2 family glycosyltransferase
MDDLAACRVLSTVYCYLSTTMDLTVIIVNYNVRQFLENALASIARALEGIQGEVIVVDNASRDGSVAMVQKTFPWVRVIANTENVGFARANNAALRMARGRHILLINPDSVVQEDTFKVMIRFLDAHPQVGLAGCKVLNPDGTFQLPCRRSFPTPWVAFTKMFGLSGLFPQSRLFGRYNLTYRSPDETYPVDAVSGSFMIIRAEVYQRIGGLDESFFMYGEDLDWCFRVQQAGFAVYYVHETSVIHFKGESTRRSNINEVRLFYQAMELFVAKHFRRSMVQRFILSLGITFREALTWVRRFTPPLVLMGMDFLIVDAALFLSAFIYFQDPYKFIQGASHVVWFAPGLLVVLGLAGAGVYHGNRFSPTRAAIGVVSGYLVISAAVFFFKNLAYSRAVVALAGFVSVLAIPTWKVILHKIVAARMHPGGRRTLFGGRTLIVGIGESARELLRRLRGRMEAGYDVVGFVDTSGLHVGEMLDGVEIVGSMENVGKVVEQLSVSDVIFSTDGISYAEILSVITRSNNSAVSFRLVPNSLEAIIGKTRIDQLDTIPLVDIDYNLHLPSHRLLKRLADVIVSSVFLLLLYIPVRLSQGWSKPDGWVRAMPAVFAGRRSIVGLPSTGNGEVALALSRRCGEADLGPIGLTGLIQVNAHPGMTEEEMERYALFYAKNHSFGMDVEIIMKSIGF